MTDPTCALCQLAATPIDERETKTFFVTPWDEGDIAIVRDANLGGSPDRLLCFWTIHAPYWTDPPEDEEGLNTDMEWVLQGIANAEFGEGNWDFEVTMRSCPQHGWHCHARRKG